MKYLILEKQDGIGTLTINRPEALNALNSRVLSELNDIIGEIENDDEISVLILTGTGKAFVAGADIGEMKNLSAVEGKRFGDLGNTVFRRIENMKKPVIAAVNGFALGGGCELCMSCDLRVASEKAKFGQPETGLGITPGFGGTQRLPRIVGAAKAKELIYTAKTITAQEALEIGLVNQVAAPEELMNAARAMAAQIAKNAQVAVRQSKRAINMGLQADIATGLAYEGEAFGLCFSTEDQKNAMTAFVEKRKPDPFKNK